MEEIELQPATIYQALGGAQGVMYTGAALASAQAPDDLTLVDGLMVQSTMQNEGMDVNAFIEWMAKSFQKLV